MKQNKLCEVEECDGIYIDTVTRYVNRFAVRNDKEKAYVTPEEYALLEDKKGFHAVISTACNKCGDDLNDRLVQFIRSTF